MPRIQCHANPEYSRTLGEGRRVFNNTDGKRGTETSSIDAQPCKGAFTRALCAAALLLYNCLTMQCHVKPTNPGLLCIPSQPLHYSILFPAFYSNWRGNIRTPEMFVPRQCSSREINHARLTNQKDQSRDEPLEVGGGCDNVCRQVLPFDEALKHASSLKLSSVKEWLAYYNS